eukprot:scaffold16056_cov132-Isochrysis_galbana.AAC.1
MAARSAKDVTKHLLQELLRPARVRVYTLCFRVATADFAAAHPFAYPWISLGAMGDPAQYPEIRAARFQYAMQWLPPDLRADYQLSASFDNNGSTTTCPTSTAARSPFFNLEILPFVGILG